MERPLKKGLSISNLFSNHVISVFIVTTAPHPERIVEID